MGGWPAVVMAIALSVIAVTAMVFVVAQVLYLRALQQMAVKLDQALTTLDREGRPALLALRSAAEEGGRMLTVVRAEAEALTTTSRELRARVETAADRLGARMDDLESLADLLQDEVEDTVLDVAAVLRSARRGSGLLRTMKRAFLRGG